jgi:penicillin G amidase
VKSAFFVSILLHCAFYIRQQNILCTIMKSSSISFIISLAVTLGVLFALNTRMGSIPPVGKFLNPLDGVWRNAIIPDLPGEEHLRLDGLHEPVTIVYNERGVPHIFAGNDHDLYYAMGYTVARDRLWQMEFSTHAAAGRVSEIVGKTALNYDRHQRRIGMSWGAERIHDYAMQNPQTALILQAYSDGVNAWIDNLTSAMLPLEYKLLDYNPEAWNPKKTAIFYMNMNQTLTSNTNAYSMSTMKALLGPEVTAVLFPDYPPRLEPIITAGTRWEFEPVDRPRPAGDDPDFIPEFVTEEVARAIGEREPGVGSNNWAVSGNRSASGVPLLATDPHLTLSLPAIWYEIQLHAPGINSYGVTLPGVPGIIMGFNDQIAWGNTNTGGKTFDIFEVTLNESLTEYLYDGAWKPVDTRVETIQVRGGEAITDTVRFTHHGPVAYMAHETSFSKSIPVGHAVRWIAHEPTDPVEAFYIINRAESLSDFRQGLSLLDGPTQNYVFASVSGDIAMQLNGFNPIRYPGMGRYILDGSSPANDWVGYIPFEQLPSEVNPQRGFVSSANQHPADENYPYFLGWDFAPESRASIINRQLRQLDKATWQDMIALQMNSENNRAYLWLDRMMDSTAAWIERNPGETPDSEVLERFESLRVWNRLNEATSIDASVFNTWLQRIQSEMWDFLTDGLDINPVRQPSITVTLETLFHQYHPEVYEKLSGTRPQTGKILINALEAAVTELKNDHGLDTGQWQWSFRNGSTINHLLNIEALNHPRLRNDGSSESPNAVRNAHGPSWRMVTEMTRPVKAWGVYPGGQSGNPARKAYTAFIHDWQHGNHYTLQMFESVEAAIGAHGKNHSVLIQPLN